MLALIEQLSPIEWVVITGNALLLVFSRAIFSKLGHGKISETTRAQLHIFRVINALAIVLVLFYHLYLPIAHETVVTRALGALMAVYFSYLGFHVTAYSIKARFGKARELSGARTLVETYTSRLLVLLCALFFFVVGLISVVRISGFDSLLEAGGVIGFIGVLLALTQAAWAPDIISGLVILNGNLAVEGDVVELDLDGGRTIATVFKTKIFHTELLDLANNHRMMIKNARLRDCVINNLSKFASSRGLREVLEFKIGYEVAPARVHALFARAFDAAGGDRRIRIERQHEPEVRVLDTGDHAVRWAVYYYTKDVRHVLGTRQLLREQVLVTAAACGIDLATPILHRLADSADARAPVERLQAAASPFPPLDPT